MGGYVSEQTVYSDVVRQDIDYPNFSEWFGDEKAEEIVQMIIRQICSRKKTERICGQNFPREIIKSAMLKVDIEVLQITIEQIQRIDSIIVIYCRKLTMVQTAWKCPLK